MVLPAGKLAHFAVVHAQFGLGLLKTLLNRPAQATEPYERFQQVLDDALLMK